MINQPSYRINIAPIRIVLLLLVAALIFSVNNNLYIGICLLTITLILGILWRYNRPGILIFAFALQWLQIITYVFWMNAMDFGMDHYSPNADKALILSCMGLLLIAIMVHLLIRRLHIPSTEELKAQVAEINDRRLLILYIISTIFLSSIGFIFSTASGVTQFLVTISTLKWVFLMWYGFVVFLRKKNKLLFALIIGYEFGTSLYSYFSNFKDVIFIVIIIALTFITSIKVKQLFLGILTTALLSVLLLTWSAIKSDYRKYVNKGQRQQVVAVERSEALNKIQTEVSDLSAKNYRQALFMSLYRVQYIYNFSLAIDRVPAIVPYQDGGVWLDNISFVITPRILFPEKEMYNASEKARKFTGLRFAGLKEGSSFSLGYFVDCFVDFGPVGMFIPLALIGLFVGVIYRVFYKMEHLDLLLRFAIINVCLYNFISFEADGLYLFGRLLTNFIVYWLLSKTLFPFLQKWVYKPNQAS